MEDVSWLVPELVVMVVSVVVVVVSMGTDTGLLFVFSVCVSVPSWLIVAVEVAVGQDRVETESPRTSVRSSEWLGSMMLRVSGVVTVWLVLQMSFLLTSKTGATVSVLWPEIFSWLFVEFFKV